MVTISFLIITTILFIFGTIIGSFLSVVILRSISGENWVKGRSRCDSCKKTIAWYDNIPLLSFLILRGQCRHCKKPILPLHPMVEVLTGVLFMWWYWAGSLFFRLTIAPYSVLQPIFWLMVGVILIYIFIIDLNTMKIHNNAVISLTVLAIIYRLSLSFSGIMQIVDLYSTFLAALISYLFFYAIYKLSIVIYKREGMGFGDVLLVVPLALLLGAQKTIVCLFLAFIIGAVVGLIQIAISKGKTKLRSEIPFGPFLIIGTAISLIWGQYIYSWYWSLIML